MAYVRDRGTRELVGECMVGNAGMAALARKAGFAVTADPDHETLQLVLALV